MYIILVIIVVSMQLKISDSFSHHYLKEYIKDKSYNWRNRYAMTNESRLLSDDVQTLIEYEDMKMLELYYRDSNTTSLIVNWVIDVLIPVLYGNNKTLLRHNFLFGPSPVRASIRQLVKHKDKDAATNEIFQNFTMSSNYKIEDDLGSEVMTDPIYIGDDIINYTEPGNSHSPYSAGGYVVNYPKNREDALKANTYLESSNLMSGTWVNLVFEFLYYNRNNGQIAQNLIVFTRAPSGMITKDYYLQSTRVYYEHPIDYFRLVLEIVMICCSSLILYQFLKDIKKIY